MTRTKYPFRASIFGLLAMSFIITSSKPAHALQGGEDPDTLPVLVDKRFGNDGVHQLSAFFSSALATKFVEATGVYAAYGYNFSDILGAELGGGYFFGSESAITSTVREEFDGDPPLGDLYQLQWLANVDLVVVPFYGKMSFASQIDPPYDLYLLAGGGVVGLRKQVGGADSKSFESTTGASFNFGLGLRFYFMLGGVKSALRLELRNFFYPDPQSNPNDDPDKSADPLTFNLHFQGGFQFGFGGG